ncbi:large subunit ribosomal protein L32 [Desulfitispora alkaliphila]|uniref:50S ribosomal protein L32 n=1 Tax=Desulfitispora alkaliphila TaxID=622674 RepID=UPI003D1E86B4
MAVPKRRTSKSKKNMRRANWKISAPKIAECPQCHEPKLPHRVCPECGFYKERNTQKEQQQASGEE